MSKNIYVVFSDYPFGTNKTSEKLRLAVGLTVNDENILNIVFLGNARYALQELHETTSNMKPVFKHIEMLADLNAKFYVETGNNFSVLNKIECQNIKTYELNDLLDKADVVIH